MSLPVVNNTNFSQFALLIGAGSSLAGAGITQGVNWLLGRHKMKADASEALTSAGNDLIKSLLDERTALLSQLLAERRFYEEKIQSLESRFDASQTSTDARIRTLEQESLAKDKTILDQQRQLNEAKLRVDAQERLIEVLQGKNPDEHTAHGA